MSFRVEEKYVVFLERLRTSQGSVVNSQNVFKKAVSDFGDERIMNNFEKKKKN